jgi:hypothetical protein
VRHERAQGARASGGALAVRALWIVSWLVYALLLSRGMRIAAPTCAFAINTEWPTRLSPSPLGREAVEPGGLGSRAGVAYFAATDCGYPPADFHVEPLRPHNGPGLANERASLTSIPDRPESDGATD